MILKIVLRAVKIKLQFSIFDFIFLPYYSYLSRYPSRYSWKLNVPRKIRIPLDGIPLSRGSLRFLAFSIASITRRSARREQN